VPEPFEGQGIGSELARAALDHARSAHLHVISRCPFVSGYIKRHPEYTDLLHR
jgi:predicted GNAT family acetyltransferase